MHDVCTVYAKSLALEVRMNRRRRKQIAFHDTPIGFGQSKIFPNNRWVKLAELVPWGLVDKHYAKNFEGSKNGNVAIDSRIAFGALIIQIEMKLSDEGTDELIQEIHTVSTFLVYLSLRISLPLLLA